MLELPKIADKIETNIFINESQCVQDIILLQDNPYFKTLMSCWIREYIRKQIEKSVDLIPCVVKATENNMWLVKTSYAKSIKQITDESVIFINEWFEKNDINIKVGTI
jgi:hypothetical protein